MNLIFMNLNEWFQWKCFLQKFTIWLMIIKLCVMNIFIVNKCYKFVIEVIMRWVSEWITDTISLELLVYDVVYILVILASHSNVYVYDLCIYSMNSGVLQNHILRKIESNKKWTFMETLNLYLNLSKYQWNH